MKILAIETSCDETGAAILEKKETITVISNVVATSLATHATTGGIIPENAARAQVTYIMPVLIDALLKSESIQSSHANADFKKASEIIRNSIDAIAITSGPGLIGSLLVGVETAKTLSFVLNKPLLPVNHLLAHIFANYINRKADEIVFPFVGLIVSGGHTDLLLFKSLTDYEWLGGTRDDAAGEAIDKVGRLLELNYPAGPEIEKRALMVKTPSLQFTSPIMHEDNFDFSFSGLKTQVMRFVEKEKITDSIKNEICYATQKAIIDVIIKKTLKAAHEFNAKSILVGGGVSANQALREQLESLAGIPVLFPEKKYSTDNAAMIGAYALMNPVEKNWQDVNANPELYFQ